jgi:hypothetical protein
VSKSADYNSSSVVLALAESGSGEFARENFRESASFSLEHITAVDRVWMTDGSTSPRAPFVEDRDKLARFEQCIMPHLDAAYNLARWLATDDSDAQDVV